MGSGGIVLRTEAVTIPLAGCTERLVVEYTTQAVPFHEVSRRIQRSGDCGALNEPPVAGLQLCLLAGGRLDPCSVGTEPFLVETDDPDARLSIHPGGSTDPDGTILAYSWFIDGEPATTDGSFTMPVPETGFDLRLVVEDNQGATAETTLRVDIG